MKCDPIMEQELLVEEEDKSGTRLNYPNPFIRSRIGLDNLPHGRFLNDVWMRQPSPHVFTRCMLTFQSAQSELDEVIADSRWMLEIGDDWDDEGAEAIDNETWELAVKFLRRTAADFKRLTDGNMPVPSILPGPDGSIDLHWENDHFELLINVPSDANQLAEFYGDNYGKITVKGSMNLTCDNLGPICWLIGVMQ